MKLMALVYFALLAGLLAFGLKARSVSWPTVVAAVFILVWTDLVLTAHVLSLFSLLDRGSLYFAVSIVLAIAMLIGLRLFSPHPPFHVAPFASFGSSSPAQTNLGGGSYLVAALRFVGIAMPAKVDAEAVEHVGALLRRGWPYLTRAKALLVLFLVATAALVLLANFVLAYALLPANPDSIVYRFPRAYWYLAQGSLNHITNSGDPRVLYYPFNGTLAYLPLVHLQLGPRWFSLLSLLSWMICGLITYEFARNLGGPRLAAASTAWIVCLTPNVLLQALSTNDEIIAATAMLAGLFFVHRWYLGRDRLDLLIGILGIGLSVGTKLHVTFYFPLLLAIALVLAIHWRSTLEEVVSWNRPRALTGLAGALCIGLVLSCSFLVYNYISASRLSAWEFNAKLLNQPFSWHAAVQTNILFAAQTVLTPFADLHLAFDSSQRAQHYEAFNRLVEPLFRWVNNSAEYMSVTYRFTGINSPVAVVFNEHTIFIGFTWLAWLVAAAKLFTAKRTPEIIWARFQVISFLAWFITFAASTRYIQGFATYLTYPTIIAGPALVYAFAPIRRTWLGRARWAVLGFVAATHCFFALAILMSSSPRNLIVAHQAPRLPLARGFGIDKSTLAELAKAKQGIVDRNIAWGQPHWAFMAYNPSIRHYFASTPSVIRPFEGVSVTEADGNAYSRFVAMPRPDDERLNIYTFRQLPSYGDIAIRIPDMASSGLTWIGDVRFVGPEWVFAAGNDVASRHLGRDKFIVIHFNEVSDFGHDPQPIINVRGSFYGLGPTDKLSFRYELHIDGALTDETSWQGSPQATLKTDGLGPDNGLLTVFVRNDVTGSAIQKDVFLRGKEPQQL